MSKTAKEWFEDADRRFVDAVQRVMTATTSESPMTVSRAMNWELFRQEMRNLTLCAEERHMAKHAACLEAVYAMPKSVTIYRDGSSPSSCDPGGSK